jgi:undecaprenyl-diphosphatase
MAVNYIILGIVQGITEFLPISSSAHLVILQHLMKIKQPVLLDCLLHLATLLVVVIFLSDRIKHALTSLFNKDKEAINLTKMFLAATASTGVVGLLFYKIFERAFEMPKITGLFLIITGILLREAYFRKTTQKKEYRILDAVAVGIAQGLAILPGISRVGATVSVALILGWEREKAGEFSFLISIPAIVASVMVKFKDIFSENITNIILVLASMIAAFITGMISINYFWKILITRRWIIFSVYCIVVGAFIFLLL